MYGVSVPTCCAVSTRCWKCFDSNHVEKSFDVEGELLTQSFPFARRPYFCEEKKMVLKLQMILG